MKITAAWLLDQSTQAVFDAYETAGFSLYAVGGCVRNTILNEAVTDIDMTSNAPPDLASAFLLKAGFRVIPTGIDHGTITVLSNGTPYEITTFRKDVETDGRHAVVAFGQDLNEDAKRRDFTINALYADRHGLLTDPVKGLSDISGPNIRFIGDPIARIREDYLRTLRFFRFHAHYAKPSHGFDPETLAAIAATLDGLETLSRERVGAEVLKLLAAHQPTPALMTMQQTGVLMSVLPGTDPRSLGPLVHFERVLGLEPDPILRLSAILDDEMAKGLRLSKVQFKQLQRLRKAALGTQNAAELGYRLGHGTALAALALRAALLEAPIASNVQSDVERGANATFPVKAADLGPNITGKHIGDALRNLESAWILSNFKLTKEQLLQ
ncbi:MAG: CCA tRNA nucleotidyltransferase [Paracoccaceae bacterium]